jgi:hypothetical protein
MSKKISIYLADETLQFLSIIARENEENIGISSAVNLVTQIAAITATQKINLSQEELLYCCDILNGGANLTEFMPPDRANVAQSLQSMVWSLHSGVNEPGILEKWGIDITIVDKIDALETSELFALAFATRVFWSDRNFNGYKKTGDCESYKNWADQFIVKNQEAT